MKQQCCNVTALELLSRLYPDDVPALDGDILESGDTGAKNDPPEPTQINAVSDMQPKLLSALKACGVKNAAGRLQICGSYFKLTGTAEEHAQDTEVLLDFEKITPLVDAGFVPLDAESDGTTHSITIIPTDTVIDTAVPDDIDDPDKLVQTAERNEDVLTLAAQLIDSLQQH